MPIIPNNLHECLNQASVTQISVKRMADTIHKCRGKLSPKQRMLLGALKKATAAYIEMLNTFSANI